MTEHRLRSTEPAPEWTGRSDGEGAEHQRWHHIARPVTDAAARTTGTHPCAPVVIGFRSDEGVRRNQGRRGAAEGPDALRTALAGMALPEDLPEGFALFDAGNVVVEGEELEQGQAFLGETVAAVLDAGNLPVVFGGGHEVAYGTYLGLAGSRVRGGGGEDPRQAQTVGILNIDAHFDLRGDPVPSSGTPFLQMLRDEQRAETQAHYAVVGISQPSNTRALFRTAQEHDVDYLLDEDCTPTRLDRVTEFVDRFLARADLVYLTIDLDVLPAAVAPGVSAPAAYGVDLSVVQAVCDQVAGSGRLAVVDVAELNPSLDADGRTARTAARLVHRIITRHRPITREHTHEH